MTRKWGRLKTSQWHIIHSVRVDGSGDEFMLTIDGFRLPSVKNSLKWDRELKRSYQVKGELTGAKIFEGERPPGRRCSSCTSFVYNLERSVELDT